MGYRGGSIILTRCKWYKKVLICPLQTDYKIFGRKRNHRVAWTPLLDILFVTMPLGQYFTHLSILLVLCRVLPYLSQWSVLQPKMLLRVIRGGRGIVLFMSMMKISDWCFRFFINVLNCCFFWNTLVNKNRSWKVSNCKR